MQVATLFQDGQNQAVRLPEEFEFNTSKVYIEKKGNTVVLRPCNDPWKPLFDSLDEFSDDFMETREQPDEQIRENLFK